MARMARAEVFAPDEVVVVHVLLICAVRKNSAGAFVRLVAT